MVAGLGSTGRSSAVREIAYNTARQELFVAFHNGSEYVYYGVARDVYDRFRTAESWGAFVNKEIKRRYFYRKLAP